MVDDSLTLPEKTGYLFPGNELTGRYAQFRRSTLCTELMGPVISLVNDIPDFSFNLEKIISTSVRVTPNLFIIRSF